MSGFSRLSHAYIADGAAVDELAMAAVCSGGTSSEDGGKPCRRCNDCKKAERHIHPDVITIDRLKDKRELTVDQIRDLKSDIHIAPNEAPRKAYIINNADTMNTSAQNAFLHMLEEPPAHAVFILKTNNPAALLETVRSRCVKSGAHPTRKPGEATEGEPSEASQLAADFVAALGDDMLLTRFMFRLEKAEKPVFADFIPLAREQLALSLRNRNGTNRKTALHASDLLTKAAEMLDLNVSTGHISGMLCASLIGE